MSYRCETKELFTATVRLISEDLMLAKTVLMMVSAFLQMCIRDRPYKVLRCRARADRVVRPYKPRRRAGCPQPVAGSCTAPLVKPPVIAKPVTDVTGCGNPSPFGFVRGYYG